MESGNTAETDPANIHDLVTATCALAPVALAGDEAILDDRSVAVAIEVLEETDPSSLPRAVEYDSTDHEDPPKACSRRLALKTVARWVCAMVVAGVISAAVMMVTENDDETIPRENLGIREEVELHFGETIDLANSSSPYTKALQWIILKDPMEPHPDDANFIQRYTLAYFYFATTAEGPWKSCNPPKEESGESSFCSMFKSHQWRFYTYEERLPASRWLIDAHECTWAGVLCNDQQNVTTVELYGFGSSGTFPEGVNRLSFLESLALAFGEHAGHLPASLASLQSLVKVDLRNNAFSGTIPSEWGRLTSLEELRVEWNRVEGTLPSELGKLARLKSLRLWRNRLEGTIPSELGELNELSVAYFSDNGFSGRIPAFMFKPSLERFFLDQNLFTGSIPSEVGVLSSIEHIGFSFNFLSGTLPNEIYQLSLMKQLDLRQCNLTGEVSPLIGQLAAMEYLDISKNSFRGRIPDEIARLTNIIWVWLHDNQFTGTISSSLCALRDRRFNILQADCLETVTPEKTLPPEIVCPDACCTTCCDGNGKCLEMSPE